MSYPITASIGVWLYQVRTIVRDQFVHMQPTDYGIGLVFCIAIGWVLLNGRR
ncbi:MAG: hypothetical protein R3C19_05905 [Planctomycetaceae bacterium]